MNKIKDAILAPADEKQLKRSMTWAVWIKVHQKVYQPVKETVGRNLAQFMYNVCRRGDE